MPRLPRLLLLASFSLSDCTCVEHPLYNANVNRFDSYYLGGGNSQTRPFRQARLDPDRSFDVELVAAFSGPAEVPETVFLRALVSEADDADAIVGVLRHRSHEDATGDTITTFSWVDDEVQEASLSWPELAELAAAEELEVAFADANGAEVVLLVSASDLSGALDEYRAGESR